MTPDVALRAGLTAETSHLIEREQTAPHLGSGDVLVYATPAMAALAERLCAEMVAGSLEAGQSTVGVFLQVRHRAPTPTGQRVHAQAVLQQVQDEELSFRIEVHDEHELIGEIEHRRVIIDVDRFMQRVRAKQTDS